MTSGWLTLARVASCVLLLAASGVVSACGGVDDTAPPGVGQPQDDPKPGTPPDPDPPTPPPVDIPGIPEPISTNRGLNRYYVNLNPVSVNVNGTNYMGRLAFLLDGDVYVRGSTSRRVTIAARSTLAGKPADIHIIGDTVSNGSSASLGLIAQGNVIVETRRTTIPYPNCPVSNIRAAIVAETGRFSIEPDYLSEIPVTGAPQCGALTVTGSVSSHHAPVLSWSWGPIRAGFSSRNYVWDTNLLKTPPPYFPTAEDWKLVGWKEANASCLGASFGNQLTCT